MVDYSLPLFQNPTEVWPAAKCAKLAKSKALFNRFGTVHYNGGCAREDKWWQGENFPFPTLADGYEWKLRPTWGWYIVHTECLPAQAKKNARPA